jgi:hypothetical protein
VVEHARAVGRRRPGVLDDGVDPDPRLLERLDRLLAGTMAVDAP